MSLANKYRPQTFDEMIGQEHISDILKAQMIAREMEILAMNVVIVNLSMREQVSIILRSMPLLIQEWTILERKL